MTKLIDSHVHIWDPAVNGYGWLSGELNRAYLPQEYQASAPQTTGVIFVEAEAGDAVAEAAWVDGLGWPQLLGIVAQAPLERGADVVAHLDRLAGVGRVVGIRRQLQDEPIAFLDDEGLLAGLRLLAARGMPFDACVRHAQLPALTALLRRVTAGRERSSSGASSIRTASSAPATSARSSAPPTPATRRSTGRRRARRRWWIA